MSFTDPDPLEQDMGVLCQDMSPDQLVSYIKSYHEAFGLNLKIAGNPEVSVFRAMHRLYGRRDTGLIVKWAFYAYRGRHDGQPLTPLSFAKGRKWWVDRMHLEMQEEVRRSDPRSYQDAELDYGMKSLSDL